MFNKLYVVVGGCVVMSIVHAGLGIAAWWENRKMNKKVGTTFKDLKNLTSSELSEKILKEAVDQAASEAVEKSLKEDNKSILEDAKSELSKNAKDAVKNCWKEMSEKVSEELSNQVADIEPDSLKDQVKTKAENILTTKFSHELDDLLARTKKKAEGKTEDFESDLDKLMEKYSDNLSRIKKIYDSVGEALSDRKRNDGLHFTVN